MSEMRFLDRKAGRGPFVQGDGERPDVVLISIDMVPWEAYGPASPYAAHLRLPNMRQVAADGVTLANAFAVSPLCGPSRAGYLTGRYPYITVNEERAHDGQAVALRSEDGIFPEYLRAAGYVARHVGKCHVGTELFTRAFGENDAPWDRWAPPITDDDGYAAHLRRLGIQPMAYSRTIQGVAADRQTPGNLYGGWVAQADGAPFPLEGTYPYYLAKLACETLETALARRTAEQPLYLQLDFFAPHQPFMIPAGFEERERALREVVELPASYWAARERDMAAATDEPRIYEVYRRNWGLYDPATAVDYVVANLLQMEVLDRALGVLMAALRERGLYDDSLIILMGDHGEMNTERALIDKGVYGHPRVARAPLAVKAPQGMGVAAGRQVDEPVSLLDVTPTILEMTGIEPLARLDGQSLWPLLRDEPWRSQRPILFECHWHVAPNPAVSLIWTWPETGRPLMYTYNLTSDVDELYGLDAVGDEANRNRAADPAWAAARRASLQALAQVLSQDPRWRCYWHPLRLDKGHELELGGLGDMQMFVPEH